MKIKLYKSIDSIVNAIRTFVQDYIRSRISDQSSSMAYLTLFSLVPSLAAIFSLLSLFVPMLGNQAHIMSKARELIFKNLATGTGDLVIGYLDQFLSGLDLKKIGFTSFAGLFVSLVLLLRQIEIALNQIWAVHKSRNPLVRFVYFWTFITLGTFLLGVVLGLTADFSLFRMISEQAITKATTSSPIFNILLSWVSWTFFFYFIYKVVPNCRVANRSALLGAVIAGALIYWGSKLYGIYAKDFNNYRTIYGTLAAVPLFILWIYICWQIVLIGALISWRHQHGMPKKEHNFLTVLSPREEHRNTLIRAHLPFLTLLYVEREFSRGTGRGISAEDLALETGLPLPWIEDALEILTFEGHIHEISIAERDVIGKTVRYVPSKPGQQMTIAEIARSFSLFSQSFIDLCRHAASESTLALVEKVAARCDHNPKATVASCLQ